MSDTTKRHLISAGTTFLTGFGLVVLNDIDGITLESIRSGALTGTLFAATRAGLKALLEFVLRR